MFDQLTKDQENATAKSTRVIACGALAREILAIIHQNKLNHIDLVCLPAILHNTPDKIPAAVEAAIQSAQESGFEDIFIGFADCGTGGLLDKICEKYQVARIDGPHCYAFFTGVEAFSQLDEISAFYLTDFLANQFEAFVTKPLGLDRHPELRDVYFSNYTKLVYLSQISDEKLVEKAKEAADLLGLAFEHRHTGYGELANAIKSEVQTLK